jgi:hypothetical protein
MLLFNRVACIFDAGLDRKDLEFLETKTSGNGFPGVLNETETDEVESPLRCA